VDIIGIDARHNTYVLMKYVFNVINKEFNKAIVNKIGQDDTGSGTGKYYSRSG
jgi:hypothetical protein